MNKENIVEVNGVSKVFKDFWQRPKIRAVDDLDLEVRKGEIFGLLGPNGSGKSTTIKMLLGLLYPTSGSITVMKASPDNVAIKAKIGYLPEETYLHGHLTGRETLSFYSQLFNMSRQDRNNRIAQLIKMTNLESSSDRPVGEFSKGMARRIGLAQSLINDPELLILDEPTSGLDPIACRQIKDILKTLAKRGKTVIVTSHLLADMEDVCDRVAIMFAGRIIASGTVTEILSRKDMNRLTFPALAQERLAPILSAIKISGGQEPILDSPSIDLERFFIDEVKKADIRSNKLSTDQGDGPKIADYLSHD